MEKKKEKTGGLKLKINLLKGWLVSVACFSTSPFILRAQPRDEFVSSYQSPLHHLSLLLQLLLLANSSLVFLTKSLQFFLDAAELTLNALQLPLTLKEVPL